MICAICGKSLTNVVRAWDDAPLCESCAEPSVPASAVEGITVAGARAFWRWKDEAAAHERLRAAVMTIYSDPHLTWEQARIALAQALTTDHNESDAVDTLRAERDRLREALPNVIRLLRCVRVADCGAHFCRYCAAKSPEWLHAEHCHYVQTQRENDEARGLAEKLADLLTPTPTPEAPRGQDFFDMFSTNQDVVQAACPNVLVVRWSRKGLGFGRFSFIATPGGLHIDTERMASSPGPSRSCCAPSSPATRTR